MHKKVTLRDVAELANVATGTASQALNNKAGVLPATRERVLNIAKQLGYDQRFILTVESHTDLKTIGVLKHEIYDRPGTDPFYFPVISGVEQECQKLGFTMVYATVDVDNLMHVTRLPASLKRNKLDGLICVGTFLDDIFSKEIISLNCPVVLIDGYTRGEIFDSVRMNNLDGAYQAVSFLIENGHRHIGLIGSTEDTYPSLRERREGYLRALKDHGIADIYIEDGLIFRDAAYAATANLMKKYPQITALFTCNDNAAIGAMNSARNMDYVVPDNLSIIGFDDISFAQDMLPPLTTMHVDKILLGKLAVRQLIYRAEHLADPVITIALKTNLVVRKSVKNISQKIPTLRS